MTSWSNATNDSPATMPASDWRDVQQWPEDIRAAFAALPEEGDWHVALSGGLDSVVLLHCIAALAGSLGLSVNAIHVNHGLQSEALDWESHCNALCHALGICFTDHRVKLDPGMSDLEARARHARYEVFENALGPGDTLFMAHHGDDQAETVLLRLLRGSGVRGLAGMPATRDLGAGRLHRPLLALTRDRIESVARDWGLSWCEDRSNQDTRFDRNYLRHVVMPVLRERWPGTASRFNRSARHCREADGLLETLARWDAETAEDAGGVSVERLTALSASRRQQLMRHLMRCNGLYPPSEKRLGNGLEALITASPDGYPELRGEGYRIRRFQDRLWVLPDLPAVDHDAVEPWCPGEPLQWWGTQLEARPESGGGIAPWLADDLVVTPRRGGERIQAGSKQPQRQLKKWLQEHAVPPWERWRLPLIWQGGRLVAVADYWILPECRAGDADPGLRPVWHRPWWRLRTQLQS